MKNTLKSLKTFALASILLSGSAFAYEDTACDGNWTLVCTSSTGTIFQKTAPGSIETRTFGSQEEYEDCLDRLGDLPPRFCRHFLPKTIGVSLSWGAHTFWRKQGSKYITHAQNGQAVTHWNMNLYSCRGSTQTYWPANPDSQWQDYTCTVTKN